MHFLFSLLRPTPPTVYVPLKFAYKVLYIENS